MGRGFRCWRFDWLWFYDRLGDGGEVVVEEQIVGAGSLREGIHGGVVGVQVFGIWLGRIFGGNGQWIECRYYWLRCGLRIDFGGFGLSLRCCLCLLLRGRRWCRCGICGGGLGRPF